MTEVRKHQRTTAAGKTTTVRHHTRDTGSGGDAARGAWAEWVEASSPPPHVSTLQPALAAAAEEPWWDEDAAPAENPAAERMAQTMRDWRSLPEPEPSPPEPMSAELAKALGCDTPEGLARFERGRAYREAGYDGPLDRDGQIPDPDDPEERRALELLAALSETHG